MNSITDMIYDFNMDCLFVLYEERSDITDRYKCTKVLRFDKEIYEKTNLINIYNNYEEKRGTNNEES